MLKVQHEHALHNHDKSIVDGTLCSICRQYKKDECKTKKPQDINCAVYKFRSKNRAH